MHFNKKLLILGGSYQHIKIVKVAKELGVKTYVTDYLPIEQSPAKAISDVPLMYNVTDIDTLEKFCIEENINGVIAPYLDITQIPYQQLCERLGYYCFGNKMQHDILTNKILFKDFCKENGVDIIDTYTEQDVLNRSKSISFPILIKPNDSRGSRGQTICHNFQEANDAIVYAKEYSSTDEVIIEKYMGKNNDVEIAYIVADKDPILIRILDRYLGSKDNGFDKLAIAEIFPSKFYKSKLETIDNKLKNFIKKIKLEFSPVFFQAFIDDTVRPYDPGIRFPGDNFCDVYKKITGIDIPKIFVEFALFGKITKNNYRAIKKQNIDKVGAMIWPCLKPGKISKITGFDELANKNNFISISKRYDEGDIVLKTKDVRQRFGEFCIVASNYSELRSSILDIFSTLKVIDENGNDMIIEKLDIDILNNYEE